MNFMFVLVLLLIMQMQSSAFEPLNNHFARKNRDNKPIITTPIEPILPSTNSSQKKTDFQGGHSIDYSSSGSNWGDICKKGQIQSPVHVPVWDPNGVNPYAIINIPVDVALHFGDSNNAKLDLSD